MARGLAAAWVVAIWALVWAMPVLGEAALAVNPHGARARQAAAFLGWLAGPDAAGGCGGAGGGVRALVTGEDGRGFRMRRKDRALERDEAMRLLRAATHGTLCMAADEDGYPYAVPINCAVVDGSLVFHGAAAGVKHDVLARDDRARFVAVLNYEGVEETFSAKYESVIAKGRVQVVVDDAERLRILRAFTAQVFDVSEASIADRVRAELGGTRMLRMSIDELTGKRSPKA